MPRANWGIGASDVDNFDRESQFTPYTGPEPRLGVYQFQVKVLKYAPTDGEKWPQLRIGLELVPRNKEEAKFKGYFVMLFRAITPKTGGFYVPFLDALGVSGAEFEQRTIVDEEGNIKKIGAWCNDGKQLVMAQLKDSTDNEGNKRRDISWFGAVEGGAADLEDDEEVYEEEEESEYEEEEKPAPKVRRSARSSSQAGTRTRSTRRNTVDDDDF